MSVKFKRETVRAASEGAATMGIQLPTGKKLPGMSGEHPIAEAIGTALTAGGKTGGEKTAVAKGYLGVGFELAILPSFCCDIIRKRRNRVADVVFSEFRLT